jgi:hypothetical protein
MRIASWLTKELSSSQVGFCSKGFVCDSVFKNTLYIFKRLLVTPCTKHFVYTCILNFCVWFFVQNTLYILNFCLTLCTRQFVYFKRLFVTPCTEHFVYFKCLFDSLYKTVFIFETFVTPGTKHIVYVKRLFVVLVCKYRANIYVSVLSGICILMTVARTDAQLQ